MGASLQDELEAVELPIGSAEATITNETIDGARNGSNRERVEGPGSNPRGGALAGGMNQRGIVLSLGKNAVGV
jgi:hypothetical protein